MTNEELYNTMTDLAQETARNLCQQYGFSSVVILGSTQTEDSSTIAIHAGWGSSFERSGLAQHYITVQTELDRLSARRPHGD